MFLIVTFADVENSQNSLCCANQRSQGDSLDWPGQFDTKYVLGRALIR